jgi:hypothetical protein
VILASREPHCLADLLHRWRTRELVFDLRGVVSNHEDAREDVERLGVPFHHVPVPEGTRDQAFAAIERILETEAVELVVLARYMQILPAGLCERYAGRLVRAYDDSAGVTAQFNRNVLAVVNRELAADFDLGAFEHVAKWNTDEERIEISSLAPRTALLAGIMSRLADVP